MKRCSKCDKSDHRHCKRGECECPCQDHWDDGYKVKSDNEVVLDKSQDKFFIEMQEQWKKLHPKVSDP